MGTVIVVGLQITLKINVKKSKNHGKINNVVDNYMSIDTLGVLNVANVNQSSKSWLEKINMNGIETNIKLDIGAKLNIMSVDLFKQIKNLTLNKSSVIIIW